MCGRYVVTNAVTKTKGLVKSAIQIEDNENYNAHPYQNLPVIKKYTNGSALEKLKWGIVPSWSKKKDFKPLINSRLETIDEKISFKRLIKLKSFVPNLVKIVKFSIAFMKISKLDNFNLKTCYAQIEKNSNQFDKCVNQEDWNEAMVRAYNYKLVTKGKKASKRISIRKEGF